MMDTMRAQNDAMKRNKDQQEAFNGQTTKSTTGMPSDHPQNGVFTFHWCHDRGTAISRRPCSATI